MGQVWDRGTNASHANGGKGLLDVAGRSMCSHKGCGQGWQTTDASGFLRRLALASVQGGGRLQGAVARRGPPDGMQLPDMGQLVLAVPRATEVV